MLQIEQLLLSFNFSAKFLLGWEYGKIWNARVPNCPIRKKKIELPVVLKIARAETFS